jgi:hypothetical protein
MPCARCLPMIGLPVVMAAPAGAQDWDELDCKPVTESIRAQKQEADTLKRNAQVLRERSGGRSALSARATSPRNWKPPRRMKPLEPMVWQKCCCWTDAPNSSQTHPHPPQLCHPYGLQGVGDHPRAGV